MQNITEMTRYSFATVWIPTLSRGLLHSPAAEHRAAEVHKTDVTTLLEGWSYSSFSTKLKDKPFT